MTEPDPVDALDARLLLLLTDEPRLGVQECARLLLGRSLHTTSVFETSLLRCVDG